MHVRAPSWTTAVALAVLVGCHDGPTRPNGALDVGQSLSVAGAQDVLLESGSSAGDYVAVLVNTGTKVGSESYSLKGDRLDAPSMALGATTAATMLRVQEESGAGPALDRTIEGRLRDRERTDLTSRIASAQAWFATRRAASAATAARDAGFVPAPRRSALPATVKVGDTVTVNVNGIQSCTSPLYHRVRVAAIGTHSIILTDTANPPGGFTDADYRRYATRFDTLVYPIDVGAFGEPTDIDGNGRIGLIFTLEVNRLTSNGSPTYVGGFTFSRDLFPIAGSDRARACVGSNEGEFFYLLAPDPLGRVNGNRRTTGFVDTNTTAVIAHEFQHLINASRRLYVNKTPKFEEKWLDEGLAHIAEELLFYREAELAPRANLSTADIRATATRTTAFNLDMVSGGNVARYRSYLLHTAKSSPFAADDSLSTRGAAWNLLRYLADRAVPSDGNIFFRLVNGSAVGIANLQAVFGQDVGSRLRDWSVSHAVDDLADTSLELQQPSWNWRSIYAGLYGGYPLQTLPMTNGSTYPGTLVAGGAAFYRLSVPGGSNATVTLGGPSASAGSHIQLVVVRTK